MKVKVKICGVKTLESAKTAIEAGADFLGFNFIVGEKRYINPIIAKEIINSIRSQAKTVGVFQNAKTNYVNKIIKLVDLDFIQLHEKRIIKSTKDKIIYLLIDRKIQGKGNIVNQKFAQKIALKKSIFLAGGLTPENIKQSILKVKPFAVDVAGGIETNGSQDNEKIKDFIKKAKGVEI